MSAASGDCWDGKIYVNAELAPISVHGPDARNWQAVLDAFGKDDVPRDTFGQAGYLSAQFFVKAMLEIDPADLDPDLYRLVGPEPEICRGNCGASCQQAASENDAVQIGLADDRAGKGT